MQHSGHYYGKKLSSKLDSCSRSKCFRLIHTVYTENVSGMIWARVHIFHFKTSVRKCPRNEREKEENIDIYMDSTTKIKLKSAWSLFKLNSKVEQNCCLPLLAKRVMRQTLSTFILYGTCLCHSPCCCSLFCCYSCFYGCHKTHHHWCASTGMLPQMLDLQTPESCKIQRDLSGWVWLSHHWQGRECNRRSVDILKSHTPN